jgi:hypothetical protein
MNLPQKCFWKRTPPARQLGTLPGRNKALVLVDPGRANGRFSMGRVDMVKGG